MTDEEKRGRYQVHRTRSTRNPPRKKNEVHETIRTLSSSEHKGSPIPRHRTSDGVWSDVGTRVRKDGITIGFIWTELIEADGQTLEVNCRRVSGEELVSRSTADTAIILWALVCEWTAKAKGKAVDG